MKKSVFRWYIVGLLFLLNFISYVDRSAISYAISEITLELNIDSYHAGLILGSFGIGYLLATCYGGILVDRWGAKKILLIFTLVWAIAISFTGVIAGFFGAMLARFGLGIGEGPNFPAVARAVSDWLPIQSRAKALSNSLVAVPLSLSISAPLITQLMILVGWRSMFFILGAIVVLWWPLCYFFFSDKPKDSPFVNKAELAFIQTEPITPKEANIHWRDLLFNKTLLSNNWGFFVYGYSMFFFLSWLPNFLQSTYHLNIKQVGWFTFLPWLLAAILLWLGGYASDYIYRLTNNLRYARTYIILFGQLLTLICLLPLILSDNLTITLVAISLAVGFNLSNNTAFYAINIDMAKHASAKALAIMNSGFAISGFLAPVITGALVQWTSNFSIAFLFMIVLTLSSLIILFLFHHPEREHPLTWPAFPKAPAIPQYREG